MTALIESLLLMIICDVFSSSILTYFHFSQVRKPILDTGLLSSTKILNNIGILESEHMPALESHLSHFIVSWGEASVGKGTMQSWLEGLHLCHQINEAPCNGSHMLRKVVVGASKFVPAESKHDKQEPLTIEHRSLWHSLDLPN